MRFLSTTAATLYLALQTRPSRSPFATDQVFLGVNHLDPRCFVVGADLELDEACIALDADDGVADRKLASALPLPSDAATARLVNERPTTSRGAVRRCAWRIESQGEQDGDFRARRRRDGRRGQPAELLSVVAWHTRRRFGFLSDSSRDEKWQSLAVLPSSTNQRRPARDECFLQSHSFDPRYVRIDCGDDYVYDDFPSTRRPKE